MGMPTIKVVTDSTADLPAALVQQLDITVVPLYITIGSTTYRDRVDITEENILPLLADGKAIPITAPPSVEDFETVYSNLAQKADGIISIHISSRLSLTYYNALEARERRGLRDRARVLVIDSQLTSLAMGYAVVAAARAAQAGYSLDEIARLVRGTLLQTHVLFFVDTLEYLQRGGRVNRIQQLWGTITSIKPLLKLEDGEIHFMEKVRTRAKALERLYEFVADFPHIEEMAILYGTTANEAQNLAKRVDAVFDRERITIARYGPSIAAHLGPAALGVVVFEGLE